MAEKVTPVVVGEAAANAGTTQEDDDLMSTTLPKPQTPDDFKRLRTTALGNYTRFSNKVDDWIEGRVSRLVLRNSDTEFKELSAACLDSNFAYRSCTLHPNEEIAKIDAWEVMFRAKQLAYTGKVQQYFE